MHELFFSLLCEKSTSMWLPHDLKGEFGLQRCINALERQEDEIKLKKSTSRKRILWIMECKHTQWHLYNVDVWTSAIHYYWPWWWQWWWTRDDAKDSFCNQNLKPETILWLKSKERPVGINPASSCSRELSEDAFTNTANNHRRSPKLAQPNLPNRKHKLVSLWIHLICMY